MNFKRKICINVLSAAIVLFSNSFVWGSDKGEKISTIQQPYVFLGERTFVVGFLDRPKEEKGEKPIPEIGGEKICDFVIKDTLSVTSGMYARMLNKEKDFIPENFIGKHIFFTGYREGYSTFELIKENPHIEWLKNMSSATLPVFEIEQMIPVENSDSVLSISAPDRLSEKFEISVSVKNILNKQLIDSTLNVSISPGPFKIVEGESSGYGYYNSVVEGKYEAGESRIYNLHIETRDIKPIDKTDFGILVTFAGYGMEGDLVKPKIFPLYSRKSYKY